MYHKDYQLEFHSLNEVNVLLGQDVGLISLFTDCTVLLLKFRIGDNELQSKNRNQILV